MKEIFTDKWTYIYILLLVLVFVCGYFWASVIHQNACNAYIMEHLANNPRFDSGLFGNLTFNISG